MYIRNGSRRMGRWAVQLRDPIARIKILTRLDASRGRTYRTSSSMALLTSPVAAALSSQCPVLPHLCPFHATTLTSSEVADHVGRDQKLKLTASSSRNIPLR